jgi:hypothetical protein
MQDVAPIRIEEYDAVCPITLRSFREPVVAADGRTYEREAIVRWITEHGTSPFTRQPLNVNDLLPDYQVKDKTGRRSSSTASFGTHDKPIVYRNARVEPVNDEVPITKGEKCCASHESRCNRRRCCSITMVLLTIFLLACGVTIGLLMRKFSSRVELEKLIAGTNPGLIG